MSVFDKLRNKFNMDIYIINKIEENYLKIYKFLTDNS
jgi:hypothetical protein